MYRRTALSILASGLASLAMQAAFASQHEVQVSEIEVINDGTNNAIYVRGTFSPSVPCPTQGFFFLSADPFQKELSAIMLTAKMTGRAVSYAHVYCHANGYSRGNGYILK